MVETENRLLSVVEHWLPRIEVAGIPSATAKAVIARAGSWDHWLSTWCDEGERHVEIAETALAAGHRVTAGEAFARAALFYHFGQFMAFDAPAAKAEAAARKVALFRQAAPLLDPPAEPIEVPFDDKLLHAYLRLPAGKGPHPLALIIPGSDSTKEEFPAFERHFLARGIATLSLDGPGQGEGRDHGNLRPDFAPACRAALAAIADRPELSGQYGLVGMAFGGFLALRVAAEMEEFAAVISINGFADLGSFWDDLPQVYRDNMAFSLGAEDTAGKARGFALDGTAKIHAPALILHGGKDKIFPPSEAEKSAAHCAGRVDLHIFPDGNHVCNNIPWLYRPLLADWLADRLAEAPRA